MATPEFIVQLRRHIGHAPLWLSGVTAVTIREDRILLVQRADTRAWTPVTGIIDPGEEPAVAACRETMEETGLTVAAHRLVKVGTAGPITYGNGDVASYLDLTFRMTYVAGEPHVNDDENVDARWWNFDSLPPMSDDMHRRVDAAIASHEAAVFESE